MNIISSHKIKIATLAVSSTILLVFSGVALAHDTTNQNVDRPEGDKSTMMKPHNQDTMQGQSLEMKNSEGRKLKMCEAREHIVKNRAAHLNQLVIKMEDRFDLIAQRVKNYYTNKLVPSGKTVDNYDALVADIAAKKAVVEEAHTKAQTGFNNFSCASGKPKEAMMKFKSEMLDVKKALKEYRTSIKNLIVAVHKVTGIEKKELREQEEHSNVSPQENVSPEGQGTNQ